MCKLICFAIFFLFICFCPAATWTVNLDGSGDFTDIQSAINASNTGDTVEIANGVYSGTGNQNISFLGKAITVKSVNGSESCVVEGVTGMTDYPGFIFESQETSDSILEGITIRNFSFLTCDAGGAGIYILDASPTIRNEKVE